VGRITIDGIPPTGIVLGQIPLRLTANAYVIAIILIVFILLPRLVPVTSDFSKKSFFIK